MEVNQPKSKPLRVLKLFAIGWAVLWISLGIVHYIWFRTYTPTTSRGLWLFLAILFQPAVLVAVIAIPEILVAAIIARLKIKESQQWRKVTEDNSMQPGNLE